MKASTRVTVPVTDEDGELCHEIGTLIGLNSRYARVKLDDGREVSVGKTKVEAIAAPKKKGTKLKPKKAKPVDKDGDEDDAVRIAEEYQYAPAVAASGRSSVDNGDKVAGLLRGKSLDEVYAIAGEELGVSHKMLKAKYFHLNPGHQRMCVGNKLRGHFRNKETA